MIVSTLVVAALLHKKPVKKKVVITTPEIAVAGAVIGGAGVIYHLEHSDNVGVAVRPTPTAAPEPGSYLVLGFGAVGLIGLNRRRKLK